MYFKNQLMLIFESDIDYLTKGVNSNYQNLQYKYSLIFFGFDQEEKYKITS